MQQNFSAAAVGAGIADRLSHIRMIPSAVEIATVSMDLT
jgi:hypothetical protein